VISVVGASLMSSAAAVPLTLMPLLVLAVLQEGRLPAAQAGWVGSAYMLGQLFAVLVLPALGAQRVLRPTAAAAVVVLVGATFLSSKGGNAVLLGSWLLIGTVCGCFHFLATTTAAVSTDPRFAFSFRMAVSSTTGGAVTVVLQLASGFVDYPTLSTKLALAFAAVAGVGLLLYRTPSFAPAAIRPRSTSALSARARAGFFVIFLLFMGQHGLWAFGVSQAQQRGLVLDHVMWAIALCKFAGAAVVLGNGFRGRNTSEASSVLLPAIAVAAGNGCIALSAQAPVFWVGLLLWEVGMNVLSARLQTVLAQQSPQQAGMWMTGAIFMGAAGGPALAGLAVSVGSFGAFAMFGIGTALVPCLWTLALARAVPPVPLKLKG
jgi:hypothetical protein